MKIKRILWLILGFIGVGLGAVGAVVPMLPAFPFLMLALLGFGKSSERLHTWFIGTKLYKDNLESFVRGQGMTKKTKIRIMVTVTLLMAFGFFMMFRKDLFIPCAILAGVWLFHILYFAFGVKKYVPDEPKEITEV
ncbi:MAG: YbaN family protein [Clostridia bacterium]|nr:YbaN family protein [Clostridia bacterium]